MYLTLVITSNHFICTGIDVIILSDHRMGITSWELFLDCVFVYVTSILMTMDCCELYWVFLEVINLIKGLRNFPSKSAISICCKFVGHFHCPCY